MIGQIRRAVRSVGRVYDQAVDRGLEVLDRALRDLARMVAPAPGPVCYACGVDLRSASQDRAFVGYVDALARVPRPERPARLERYSERSWTR